MDWHVHISPYTTAEFSVRVLELLSLLLKICLFYRHRTFYLMIWDVIQRSPLFLYWKSSVIQVLICTRAKVVQISNNQLMRKVQDILLFISIYAHQFLNRPTVSHKNLSSFSYISVINSLKDTIVSFEQRSPCYHLSHYTAHRPDVNWKKDQQSH